MTSYDPAVLQHYANRLYAQARIVVGLWAFFGALAGAVGSVVVPPSYWFHGDPSGIILQCAGIGLLIGVMIGAYRSFYYRLEAQRTLCQLQIERNTRHARTEETVPSDLLEV